jgi:hypothetical protein
MATITTDLYRSVHKSQFKKGLVIADVPAPGVLYPDFYEREIRKGEFRAPDVDIVKEEGVEWVKEGGGTSLFDKENALPGTCWLQFQLPKGTVIPDSIKVRFTNYNSKFAANHYQIESATKLIRIDTFKGDAADPDEESTANLQDLLISYDKAAQDLRVAYEAARAATSNLPPYSRLAPEVP